MHETTCINIFGVPDNFLEQNISSISSYTLDVDMLNILPVFDMPGDEVDRPMGKVVPRPSLGPRMRIENVTSTHVPYSVLKNREDIFLYWIQELVFLV